MVLVAQFVNSDKQCSLAKVPGEKYSMLLLAQKDNNIAANIKEKIQQYEEKLSEAFFHASNASLPQVSTILQGCLMTRQEAKKNTHPL